MCTVLIIKNLQNIPYVKLFVEQYFNSKLDFVEEIRTSQTQACCNTKQNYVNKGSLFKCNTEPLSLACGPLLVRRYSEYIRRAIRHVCIFCPPKEAAGATRLYTHYYVLPTFNYYYRAAVPSARPGRRREAQLLPTNNQDLSRLERDRDSNK